MFPIVSFEIRNKIPGEFKWIHNKISLSIKLRTTRLNMYELIIMIFIHYWLLEWTNFKIVFWWISNIWINNELSIFRSSSFPRTVNSEANARRINMVESCFGSSGQVSLWTAIFYFYSLQRNISFN